MCNQGLHLQNGANFLSQYLLEQDKRKQLDEAMKGFQQSSQAQDAQSRMVGNPASYQGQPTPPSINPDFQQSFMNLSTVPGGENAISAYQMLQKMNQPQTELIHNPNGEIIQANKSPQGNFSLNTLRQGNPNYMPFGSDATGRMLVNKNDPQDRVPVTDPIIKQTGGASGNTMTPFKLWQSQNPNGSYADWLKASKDVDSNQLKVMKEAAPKVKRFVDILTGKIEASKDNLGVMASRWRNFMQGKIGTNDPEFAKIKTDKSLLATLLMRMHMGGRGGMQGIEYFNSMLDVGIQSPENLLGILQEIGDYADSLTQPDSSKSPKVGDVKTFPNGKKGRWDGQGWEQIP